MKGIKSFTTCLKPFANSRLYVILGCAESDFVAWCVKHFRTTLETTGTHGRHVSFENAGNIQYSLWLKLLPRKPTEIALLSHECFHVAMSVFRDCGIPIDKSTEEAFAYYHQQLLVDILSEGVRR